MMRHLLVVTLLAGCASTLHSQTAAPLSRAAATITAPELQRRIGIIADDSMMGRNTPSPGLEKTAKYVADQFRRFGLKPAGENGTFFQRYVISQRRISPTTSHVGFMIHGKHLRVDLDHDARFVFGAVPAGPVHAPAVLLGGAYTAEDAARLPAKGKAVLLVMDYRKPLTQATNATLGTLARSGASGVILISNRDSATFANRAANQAHVRRGVDGSEEIPFPIVEAHERAFGEAMTDAGIKLEEIRASATAVTQDLPELTVGFGLEDQVLDSTSAPNTIGMLEGSDPVLKHEYLVFSAHMDHIGTSGAGDCQARGGDTICNGADDDGSGTVSVIELAEAFSQPGVRPKRSVIFMTVSGEEKGLWGSQYFSQHPTVPIGQIVADLNIDMIGRNWEDTVVAIGKEHSDLGQTLNRVAEQHPELHMAPIDDRWPEENFYFRSDHYNFAKRGVPILFFFTGTHPDYHQVTDSPEKIDAKKQARIVQLLFYLGQDIANARERPKWNPESYAKIVEQKPAS